MDVLAAGDWSECQCNWNVRLTHDEFVLVPSEVNVRKKYEDATKDERD
jgi:hypothetical protein